MMELTLQNWQRKAFWIEISECCPLSVLAGIHAVTDRIKSLILKLMATYKFTIHEYLAGANGVLQPVGSFSDIDTNTYASTYLFNVSTKDYDTADAIRSAIWNQIATYATGTLGYSSFTTADIFDLTNSPLPTKIATLNSGIPQAAIADAPADAVTNYNTVTTLLGALTGAVNSANTKQNDIATRLNSLLAELRTLGILTT